MVVIRVHVTFLTVKSYDQAGSLTTSGVNCVLHNTQVIKSVMLVMHVCLMLVI